MGAIDSLGCVEPHDRAEWRAWLADNAEALPGVWIVYHKKGTSSAYTLTYDEAVEEALCVGWIDSVVRSMDAERYQQLMTPRKRGSTWSKPNKERVERLIAAGLMRPAGMLAVEAAKRDGTWTLLDEIDGLLIPEDLQAAFDDNEAAAHNFSAFAPSAQRVILYWIRSAKRPDTRSKRVAETVRLAAKGLRARIDSE